VKLQLAVYALRAVRAAERVRWPRIEVRDVVMIVLVGACLLYNAHSVNASQHTWCQTLNLLTQHPVPKPADPAANPSRARAYQFYAVFVQQRHRLGCG
jgi:hypothetical protein